MWGNTWNWWRKWSVHRWRFVRYCWVTSLEASHFLISRCVVTSLRPSTVIPSHGFLFLILFLKSKFHITSYWCESAPTCLNLVKYLQDSCSQASKEKSWDSLVFFCFAACTKRLWLKRQEQEAVCGTWNQRGFGVTSLELDPLSQIYTSSTNCRHWFTIQKHFINP